MTTIHQIQPGEIFVFGSNETGIHGAGAAYHARCYYGATWGTAEGMSGQSYAIPTKDKNIKTLHLVEIQWYVERFLSFAEAHPDMRFFVTAIGTGLAGYKHSDIAPLFKGAPDNCRIPPEWSEFV